MSAFVSRVMGGVKDALAAGDIAGAVNVAWAGAKVAWFSALTEIDSLTSGTLGSILKNLAAGRWAAAGEAAMLALRIAFQQGVIFLSGVWSGVVDAADSAWVGLQTGFDAAMGGIQKAWIHVMEFLKSWGLKTVAWIANTVLRPLIVAIGAVDPTGLIYEKARGAFLGLKETTEKAHRNLKTPEQIAAESAAIDDDTAARQQARQDALITRRGERETAADRDRIARETTIERLRRRQAELAREGSNATQDQQSANQRALDQAIAAAKAAREAADAGRPKDEDFAVSTKTESITRFSAAALELSVGRGANDPQKRIAKFSEEQVRTLREMANTANMTYQEIAAFVRTGGFA
jgi:hypothetical protein